MASIGSLSGFTGWTGTLVASVRRIAKLPPRPGVTGEARVYDTYQTAPRQIVTRKAYATLVLANTDLATARGMMNGTPVTAIDPQGESWSVIVEGVTGEKFSRPDGQVVLQLTWNLQVEAAP